MTLESIIGKLCLHTTILTLTSESPVLLWSEGTRKCISSIPSNDKEQKHLKCLANRTRNGFLTDFPTLPFPRVIRPIGEGDSFNSVFADDSLTFKIEVDRHRSIRVENQRNEPITVTFCLLCENDGKRRRYFRPRSQGPLGQKSEGVVASGRVPRG